LKFITLIPTCRNDGSPVSEAEQQAILADLWQQFGGVTVESTATGHWLDTEGGQHYQDQSLKVSVACDSARIAEAEQAVIAIGLRLGQKAMYFEVQYFDGVRILKVPETLIPE